MNILVRNRELLKNIKVGDVVMDSLTFDTHRQSSPVEEVLQSRVRAARRQVCRKLFVLFLCDG